MPSNASARLEHAHWEAASAVLDWPEPPEGVPRAASLRARIRALLRREGARVANGLSEREDTALAALRDVASGAEPAACFDSAAAFAEALAHARCVDETRNGTNEVGHMRSYVSFLQELLTEPAAPPSFLTTR